MIGVPHVGHAGVVDAPARGAGNVQELLELVAADVGEDAAHAALVVEPRRARLVHQVVRRHDQHLQHAADGAAAHQLARLPGRRVVQPLAVVDQVLAAGRRHRGAGRGELAEGRERPLVGEVVLARRQHLPADGGARVGDGGGRHQADGGVGEDRLERAGGLRLREPLAEGGHLLGVGVEHPGQGGAGVDQAPGLPVDVAVAQKGDRKRELAPRHYRAGCLRFRHVSPSPRPLRPPAQAASSTPRTTAAAARSAPRRPRWPPR